MAGARARPLARHRYDRRPTSKSRSSPSPTASRISFPGIHRSALTVHATTIGEAIDANDIRRPTAGTRARQRALAAPAGVRTRDAFSQDTFFESTDDIPSRRIELLLGPSDLAARRGRMDARGPDAWRPNRDRHVSTALKAYALTTTSASCVAVPDISVLERRRSG